MKWFGPNWGAPVCATSENVPVLIGVACLYCSIPFVEDDRGVTMPFLGEADDPQEVSAHLSCFRKMIGVPGRPRDETDLPETTE